MAQLAAVPSAVEEFVELIVRLLTPGPDGQLPIIKCWEADRLAKLNRSDLTDDHRRLIDDAIVAALLARDAGRVWALGLRFGPEMSFDPTADWPANCRAHADMAANRASERGEHGLAVALYRHFFGRESTRFTEELAEMLIAGQIEVTLTTSCLFDPH